MPLKICGPYFKRLPRQAEIQFDGNRTFVIFSQTLEELFGSLTGIEPASGLTHFRRKTSYRKDKPSDAAASAASIFSSENPCTRA